VLLRQERVKLYAFILLTSICSFHTNQCQCVLLSYFSDQLFSLKEVIFKWK